MKGLAVLAVVLLGTAAHAGNDYTNVTRGGPLKAGFYGRIAVAPHVPPPPVVHAAPTVARGGLVAAKAREAVYLYVPPGQLRRWDQHCDKWSACEEPVLFVRMDDSPSRLGDWKKVQRPSAGPSLLAGAWERLAAEP